jgi:RNA polymerase sigma-70 factor (ECF subfamily)
MAIDVQELAKLIQSQTVPLQLWVKARSMYAEDIVQEAFCRLACQHPAPSQPIAWLYRVCHNLAEKHRRADHRRQARERVRAESAVGDSTRIDPLEWEETLNAVEMLDPELREVLVARIWGQLSLDEIGRLCGMSTSTAFRRYEAALVRLRNLLEAECENRP